MATNNCINTANPITVAKGGSGLATITSNGIITGAGTGNIVPLAAATNGQLPIGRTGNTPALAAITAGTSISITNTAGAIALAKLPVSFLAYMTTTQLNRTGDATAYTPTYDSTLVNNGARYSTGTGNFTALTAGLYMLGGTWFISGWQTQNVMIGVCVVSGTFQYISFWENPQGELDVVNDRLVFTWKNLVNMSANGTAKPRITVQGGTFAKTLDFQGTTDNAGLICNTFWGYKVS